MSQPTVSIPAFQPFYLTLVSRELVSSRLRRPLTASADADHLEGLLDHVWSDVSGMVERQAFRTLIHEFHEFRERLSLPMTADSDEGLRRFRDHLAAPGTGSRLLDRYPVLRNRLETIVRQSLTSYEELFTAYDADRAALRAAGLIGAADDSIVALFGTSGDLHNDNRKVVGLTLTGGRRLVFKPRALLSDHFVRDLYAATDAYLTYSLQDCVPRSVSFGTYGWQQYVAPHPMTEPDQPARYYYRFGALCAILGSIGASDLHDENLIAGGEYPCVIDTETMVRPDAGVANDSLPHRLINQLKLSIASTMLVPMLDPASRNDLIMTGIGFDGAQTSTMKRPVVRDGETDNISVRWEPVSYRHTGNVPRLGDRALSPVAHFADLRAGHADALGAVRDGILVKVLDTYPDMPVRCLIRSTMVYAKFLDAGTHPDYLRTTDEAERIIGLLGQYPPYLSAGAAAYVGDRERESLRTGNVPLFLAPAGSTALATPQTSFPDVYRWSALDFARRGLDLNAGQDGRYHHFLMEESFGEIAGPGALSADSVFAAALATAQPRDWWPAIARTVASVGVTYDGPDGPESGWICGIGPDRGAPTLTPGNFVSFHDSGGIVTFLRNAARYDHRFTAAHRSADRGFDALLAQYPDGLLDAPESALTGGSSVLLTRPERVEPGWLSRVLVRLAERAAAGTLETDLGNGPAGLLMLLLSRIEAGDDPLVDAAELTRLHDLTVAHLGLTLEKPWFDVAHGELGLRWAVARAGRVHGDIRPAVESADWLVDRLAADPRPAAPGWCNGAAGRLLATAEIMTSAGRGDWLSGDRLTSMVDRATVIPHGRAVDLSVCHGTSGVIQSLLAAGRIIGDDSLTERAVDYQARVIAAALANGFSTGASGRTSLLGYLLGWSGIGDTDLLMHATLNGDATGLAVPVAFLAPVTA